MTLDEIALQLSLRMMENAGVRAFDVATCTQIAAAARQMAIDIYFGEIEDIMATNAIYTKFGTSITFGSEAGDTVAWSTENIANAAGRQSALYDQGADTTPRPVAWRYRIYTQAQATPTIGLSLRCYLKTSDGTHLDNDDGTGDDAVSAIAKLSNLTPLRSPIVDEAAANVEFVSQGVIEILPRYFGIVLWNAMGSSVTNDAAETKAIFTPIFDDVQAAS